MRRYEKTQRESMMADVAKDVEQQVSETPESERVTLRQRLWAATLCAAACVATYLLSAGPMAGLHKVFRFAPFQRCVEIVYAPIVFLVKRNIEPFSSLMKWYVDLFR